MSTVASLPYVEAELCYTAPTSGRPRYYYYEPGAGAPSAGEVADLHKVRIHNMRPLGQEIALDRQGFALVRQSSAVCEFWSDEEVRQTYYPEAERFIAEIMGASRVLAIEHGYRRRVPSADANGHAPILQPAASVHIDRSAGSISSNFLWRSMRYMRPQRIRELLGQDADELLHGRIQAITLWRPIRGPLFDAPLAVCDARTVDPEDLVPTDLVFPDRVAESYSVTYNPRHVWYYAPQMQADEALLLKCADTKSDWRARFVAHSSFNDPTAPPGSPSRESIELRTLVFHPA
jgi:hypothetical protein